MAAGAALQSVADEAKLDQFIENGWKLPPPKILGMIIMDTDVEEDVTKGLRFMGQRFVPDAYIFRQLIYRNVGTLDEPPRPTKGFGCVCGNGFRPRLTNSLSRWERRITRIILRRWTKYAPG